MNFNLAFHTIASEHIGMKEWPGARHNPQVLKLYKDAGHGWVQEDEVPWCAAFVNSVLAQAGVRGTGSLAARSFLEWGKEVPLDEAHAGDVVVLWRGDPSGWQGHVGFYAGQTDTSIKILGGNQNNSVNVSDYSDDRLLSVRRYVPPRESLAESTTVVAAGGAGAAAAVSAASQAMEGGPNFISVVGAFLVLACAAYIIFERRRKWRAGDR